jgi:hypothetical protein
VNDIPREECKMNFAKRVMMLSVAALLVAVTAHAGAPLQGEYKSQNSQVSHGRYAESSVNPSEFFTVGNVVSIASWDGATLGAQYSYGCPKIVTSVLILDLGSTKSYALTFTGGTFTLNGTGEAWDGGDAVYTGTIDGYTESGNAIVFAGSVLAWNRDVAWSGRFDAPYDDVCIQWTANAALDSPPGAGAYPAYVADDCTTPRVFGHQGTHTDVTMVISDCIVPTEDATWGAIKELYKNE